MRGPPQRAILGPVRLARRPASHPPDQRQSSAVTNVALCVVSAIAIKKHFMRNGFCAGNYVVLQRSVGTNASQIRTASCSAVRSFLYRRSAL
ncbi:hypothetical protein BKM09_019245 [Pseudomonas amygdali pv. morsprunorum]|nr:hypothetical protein BKM09_019245 [Pseudomonas amygdali pv. morsprunorum]